MIGVVSSDVERRSNFSVGSGFDDGCSFDDAVIRVDLNVVGDIVGGLVEVLLFWLWGDDFGDGVVVFGVVVGVFDGVVGVEVWDDDLSDGIICSVLFGALFLSNFVVPRCLVLNGGLFGNRDFTFGLYGSTIALEPAALRSSRLALSGTATNTLSV